MLNRYIPASFRRALALAVAASAPSLLAPRVLAARVDPQPPSGARTTSGPPQAAQTTKRRTTKTRKKVAPLGTARDSAARPATPPRPKPIWPVRGPEPLPGSILPAKRIIAYYGNPLSKRMGILGELDPGEMIARLNREVAAWNSADSNTPAVPALHLIAVVAQGSAGSDGMWRARMGDDLIEKVYAWSQKNNALLFLDIQVAKSTLQAELPRLEKFLARPNVHLGIDPEFSMKTGHAPGKRIGTYDARDINYAADFLASLVEKYKIPPKVLVVHRFTRPMLTNSKAIKLDPRVQVVINMDGWGPPILKRSSYDSYVYSEPVQYTGFKLFYHNDTKKGHPLMKPADVLALFPRPVYIQYQ